MRCKHKNVEEAVWRMGGGDAMTWFTRASFEEPDARFCNDCHAWLPLGPARDTEQTAIEVRAAEIAADWERFDQEWHGFVSLGSVSPNAEHVPILERSVDNAEAAGIDRAARIAMNERDLADYWTGWLAREIAEHDSEEM